MAARFTLEEVLEEVLNENSDFDGYEDDSDESDLDSISSDSDNSEGNSEAENRDFRDDPDTQIDDAGNESDDSSCRHRSRSPTADSTSISSEPGTSTRANNQSVRAANGARIEKI